MTYEIKLQKGELWKPADLRGSREVSIRIASGLGWITYKCLPEDLIAKPGSVLDVSRGEPLIEALSGELSFEIQFHRK